MRFFLSDTFALAIVASLSVSLDAQNPAWSTYFGGPLDEMPAWRGTGLLPNGHAVVVGWVGTTNPNADGFVACFDPLATGPAQCVWSTSFAGSQYDEVTGVCVTAAGAVLVCGITSSPNLPTTPGCLQPALAGAFDAFVARLDGQTGALVSCTYFGGPGNERGVALAEQSNRDIVIVGKTDGVLPIAGTTCMPYQSTPGGGTDVFVAILDPALTSLRAATYFGGSGNQTPGCLMLDEDDRPTIGGITNTGITTTPGAFQPNFIGVSPFNDGFVARFDACLTALQYSTHLAGGGTDLVQAIAPAPGGCYVIGGWTMAGAPMFPTTNGTPYGGGPFDGFVSVLDPALTGQAQLVWSTFLGGSSSDGVWDVAVDPAGMITVAGSTSSSNLRTTNGCFQTSYGGGSADGFIARLDPWRRTGNGAGIERLYVSYYGGNDRDGVIGLTLDAQGDPLLAGLTASTNLFVSAGAYQTAYGGGATDVWCGELPLLPAGITRIVGGAGCPESVIAGVNSRPFPGNTQFTFYAGGAPAGAPGVIALGLPAAAPIPNPIRGSNVCLLVAPMPLFTTLFRQADPLGFAMHGVPLPTTLAPPYGIAVQWGFFDPATGLYSASPALRL